MSWDNPPATIMVTALGSEETAVDAMQAGAGNYVVKDVHSHYLAPHSNRNSRCRSQAEDGKRQKSGGKEIEAVKRLVKG